MVVRVPPAMVHGLSASIAEVAAMSYSVFRKRFRSSYDSSPSPPLPLQKSVSKDAKDEGPTVEDEDPAARDEGPATRDKGPGEEGEAVPEGQQQAALVVGTAVSAPLGLGYGALRRRELALREDHVYSTFEVGQGSGSAPEPERSERVLASRQPTLATWTDPEDAPFIVPSPILSPMISLTVPSLIASPVATLTATIPVDEDQFIK
nr:hypothetical protein [Tanacetum cinerariifolium]